MCRLCGREACGECFAQVNELTVDRPGAGQAEMAALQARREKHAHSNPFFLSCTRRNEHQAKDFSPMTRFFKEELEVAINAMERLLIEVDTEDHEYRKGTLNEIISSKEDGVTVQNGSSNNHENQTRSPSDENLSAALGHLSQSIPSQSAPVHAPEPPRYPREPSPHTNAPPLPTQSLPVQTQAIHLDGGAAPPTQTSTPSSQPQPHTHNAKNTQSSPQQLSPSLAPRGLASPPYIPPNLSESIASIPYHEIRRYSDSELSSVDATNKFARVWELGEPLLVTDVLSKFKIQWTPEYFNEKHGDQNCLILECQTDVNKRVTVGEFFRSFGKYENRTECWKLKVRALELIAFSRSYLFFNQDWPPSTDFKSEFPELYADFSQAVPVPDFVRRDGVYNIGSHFPTNTIAPDLGESSQNVKNTSSNMYMDFYRS
jgi:lysine-specific demethylase 3